MPFSSENLLGQLDQPGIIDWAPELKNRRDAFAFLVQAIRGEQLNPNQFRNALHMVFRMAFPENANEVLQIFADLATHQDIAIRSEAVQLAIGLLRASTNLKAPLLFSDAQERSVREAMSRGLTTKVADLAREFFAI
ncbi:MAG: hypothetical protein HZA88_04185 [Verrucomicrobia bacterium]|nr:hypothetical protein [Verrucomicrobiota bacterium]